MKHLLGVVGRWAATLLLFIAAIAIARSVWVRYETKPWTRDGHVRADVVRVTPDIGGLVTSVAVHDNQRVRAGDLLFVLDQPRYAAALEEAEAAVVHAQAAVAAAQAGVASAQATLTLARREAARDKTLGNLVATETHEQNLAKVETAQAEVQKAQAAVAQTASALDQAISAREVAELNFKRTRIVASVDGQVTNLDLHPGDFVGAGQQAMALIDVDSLRIEGYFEETKLRCIDVGDAAVVHLMGDDTEMSGHVDSIAAGIADDQRSDSQNLLPAVQPTFSWVRLAQRIPVRIHIDEMPPKTLLIAGRTASVTIVPDAPGACK
ncbi:HlyD family secretion protein [Telmatospirillum sp.]|uniref:HlyD family secretion protein n=1 Tax=Telmatospirillum sp. TaxID=2079197 RepID=UPI00283DADF9|nr:HlyD family secretion protein [Telmatospirillum sp.]MDR3435295.1 HlyD family secretion protein [Telmatospirillum sp.]